jgi:uncharacterized membrane protein YfcA
MNVWHLVLIAAVGAMAGFLNTVAGGGSLVTMPMLIFLGLPSAMANGTNRVAIMAQNIVAAANFRRKGYFDWKLGLTLAIPAAVGAIVGSNIAVSISDAVFNKVLAVVMIIVLILTLWNPQKKLKGQKETLTLKDKVIGVIVFFGVGVYGGFIQAGVGFIIIASLTLLTGYSLVMVNSLKVFVVAAYMIFSLVVFIINGKVNWLYGITLAAGNSFGAYLGSTFSVKKGDKWIKVILTAVIITMSLKLFGILKI